MQCRENEVPGQCRLDRDPCCLEITNFTDHDNVGVLTQDRAKRGREVEADLRKYLNLVDPGKLILDGILNREQFQFGPVEIFQCGVKRRRFATAGWSRN